MIIVTRGYGSGGWIAAVVLRGYIAARASAPGAPFSRRAVASPRGRNRVASARNGDGLADPRARGGVASARDGDGLADPRSRNTVADDRDD